MLLEYFKVGEETGLSQGWQTRMVQGLLSAASVAKELIDGKCHSNEALKINELEQRSNQLLTCAYIVLGHCGLFGSTQKRVRSYLRL